MIQMEGVHQKIEKISALVCSNAFALINIYGNVCDEANKIKIHPFGLATFEKVGLVV